jgi:putative Holliday junction resolvase
VGARVLALDLGSKRVGVAVSDATATLASPLTTIERSGDRSKDHHRVAALVAEEDVGLVVVGLPTNMDGSAGPAAVAAQAEAEALVAVLAGAAAVVLVDERLTTVSADRVLLERGQRAPARRRVVDQVAAAVLLQGWLDGTGGRSWRAGAPLGRTAGDDSPDGAAGSAGPDGRTAGYDSPDGPDGPDGAAGSAGPGPPAR